MAFQDSCDTIIIDAVLTDIGRQKLARSNFKISKFALGDDEVDYSFGQEVNGTWKLNTPRLPVLEAGGIGESNIKYGLLSLPRQDVTYFPQLLFNQLVEGAATVSAVGQTYYLSVNDETTKKIMEDLTSVVMLENNQTSRNFIFIESGITGLENVTISPGPATKERFITNLGLMDEYMFAYCDGRLVSELLTNRKDAYFKDDAASNLYLNVVPLVNTVKITIGSSIENFETYRIPTINNEIFTDPSYNTNSVINGPRGMAMGFNLKVIDKLTGTSESTVDERYVTFGTISADLFSAGNLYDYIDTNVLLEGTATGNQLIVPIRIIRYAGT